ncbi:MAG TPA: hypothetical protein VFD58_29150 [Blastocatellia bacterium]|nr:hypothetical protein [Blastocatellia bacterium]
MSKDQTQNLNNSEPVTLESLAAQMAQLMIEFREFRAFAEPKLYDTKPIREQALKEIMEVRQELKDVRAELRRLNSHHEQMMIDPTGARSDIRDLNRRVDDLESPRQ